MLLFSAFLFLPALVFFFALIALSAPVFETIINILLSTVLKFLKSISCKYLYITLRNVKIIGCFFAASSIAHSNSVYLDNDFRLLSTGEHVEVDLENVTYYNVGNKEVLATTQLNQNTLVIKALSKGHCQILIKYNNNKTRFIHFTVVSKSRKKKLLDLILKLKNFGLKVQRKSELIYISGSITDLNHLEAIHKIKKEYEEVITDKIIIPKKFRNQHILTLYKYFWADGIKTVACRLDDLKYECRYFAESMSKDIKKYLKRLRFLRLLKLENKFEKQYCLKQKIIQISTDKKDKNDIVDNKIGLKNLFKKTEILYPQEIIFAENKIRARTIDKNQILLVPGKAATIHSGLNIPVTTTNETSGAISTQWKFIGSRTNVALKKRGQAFQISIKSHLSSPTDDNAHTYDQNQTVVNLEIDQEAVYFIHEIKQISDNKSPLFQLPLIRSIKTFSISNHLQRSKKYAIGTIQISNECKKNLLSK